MLRTKQNRINHTEDIELNRMNKPPQSPEVRSDVRHTQNRNSQGLGIPNPNMSMKETYINPNLSKRSGTGSMNSSSSRFSSNPTLDINGNYRKARSSKKKLVTAKP